MTQARLTTLVGRAGRQGTWRVALRVGLALLAVLAVALVVGILWVNRVIRRTVETRSSESMNLPTTLSGANLSLLGSRLGLDDLRIAAPPEYAGPDLLHIGRIDIKSSYGGLRGEPVRVESLDISQPTLTVEEANGVLNIVATIKRMPKNTKPLRLIIDDLTVTDALIVVRPGVNGLRSRAEVPVGTMHFRNVGAEDGRGILIKDLLLKLVQGMIQKAGESGRVPAELQPLVDVFRDGFDKQAVTRQMKQEAGKQLQQLIPPGLNAAFFGGGKSRDEGARRPGLPSPKR